MNFGSEDRGRGFFFGPGSGKRTQYLTLVCAMSLGFLFTLAVYSGEASRRWGYAMFLSGIPALSALLLLRLTKLSLTWLGIAVLYLILFLVGAAFAVGQLHTQFN